MNMLSSLRKINGIVHGMLARVELSMLALLLHVCTGRQMNDLCPGMLVLFFSPIGTFHVLGDVTYTQFCIIIDVKHQNLLSTATIVSNHHYIFFSQSRGDYSTMFVVLIEKS